MSKDIKTNAMRMLEKNKVAYQKLSLNISDALDGVTCAQMLGVLQESTFKTLVTVSKSRNYYVFVVPVAEKLDLKKAAKVVGEKSVEMLPLKELYPLTGYVHGGCSPIGMKKLFPIVIDESALLYEQIVFSGGKIGLFVRVHPHDVEKVVPVVFQDLIEK